MGSSSRRVFVVVLNYNSGNVLYDCLNSLLKQNCSLAAIVVVDNGSTDGSVEKVKARFPSATVLETGVNLGYAGGNNVGLKYCLRRGAQYVLLLNPDTVLLPETVRKMVEVCESEPSVGMVGTNLIETRFDGKYWKRGVVTVDRFCFPSPAEKNRLSFLAGGKAAESMYVSGAVLMIKAEALRKIGFFDDLYFSYSEDVDICWRARIAGYKVVVAMDATAYHLTKTGLVESDNSYSLNARRVYLREKNAIATMIKNYGLRNVFVYVGMYLHLLFVEILATRLLYPKVSEAMFSALVWNLKNLRNTLKNRGVVQRLRAVPDGDIVRFMNKDYYKLRLALALKLKATR